MVLQKAYIACLNFIYDRKIRYIRKKTRRTVLWTVFLVLSLYFILLFSNVFYRGVLFTNNQREIFMSVLLLTATVFSMDGELKPVAWNKWVALLTILGGAGLIFIRILHPIGDGYLIFGVMLLTVYPAFYLVWNGRKDYETLFDIIAGANLTVGFTYSLIIFLKGAGTYIPDFFDKRYRGTTWNANLFSMIGLTVLCCSLYLLYRNRKERKKIPLFLLMSAMGLIVILLGKSRASIVIAMFAIASVVIFALKQKTVKRLSNRGKSVLILVLLLMCTVCAVFIFRSASAENTPEETNPKAISQRFSTEGKDADEFTSGRLSMWKIYAGMLNLTGNDVDAIDWDSLPVSQAAHCHNNFLEYGYRCGVPVSLIFTALELFACMIGFLYLFSRRFKRDALLFPIIFTEMFFVNSLIDIATLPCERYAPFFFYLILAIMIDSIPNAEREEKHKEKPRVIYRDSNNPV